MSTQTIDKEAYLIRIEEALDTIRPFLQKDGGDIEIVDLSDKLALQVRLLGNCITCPMSASTMKAGVEESVKNAIPEIRSVIAVE